MSWVPRPTVRCLLGDLADSVDNAEQRSALISGSLPDPSIPLHEVAHPIIAAAVKRYSGTTPPDRRDLLRDVRDQRWAKCRHGERWRGIVLWDPDGPRWLCFAGWREEGDADDIYADFTARCTNGGETDSSAFLPNEEDRLRLEAENRIAQRAEADHRFKVLVVNTLLQALAERDIGQSVELPSGSTLRVEVVTGEDDPSDDDWISDLFVQVEVNWNEGAGAEDVVRIQDSIPGVTTEEWIADSGIHAGGDPRFYVTVDEVWAERVLAAAEEYGADALGQDPLLVLEPNDGYAHYATQREVDHGYFDGHVLRSLCGRRFVPQHDPSDRPICSECSNTKAAFDLVSGVLRRDPSD